MRTVVVLLHSIDELIGDEVCVGLGARYDLLSPAAVVVRWTMLTRKCREATVKTATAQIRVGLGAFKLALNTIHLVLQVSHLHRELLVLRLKLLH